MFLFTELYYSTEKDLNQGENSNASWLSDRFGRVCLFVLGVSFLFFFFTVEKTHLLQLLAAA